MSFWPVLYVFLATVLAMLVGWEIQRRTRNAGLVDAIWAGAMGAAAVYYASIGPGSDLSRLFVAMLGGIWGTRLSLFLLARVLREPEDGRYRFLRTHWNDHQGKFFGFYLLQAAFTAVFSIPFWIAANNPTAQLTVWMAAGFLLWLGSLIGESIADQQLAKFRDHPGNKGQTCRTGLWRYSRHPNYFFEWLHWFAWVLLAIGAPLAWLSLLGPLLMGSSLVWFTGIPFTEAQSLRSRGDDYRRYQQETSMFFPWFPRRAD